MQIIDTFQNRLKKAMELNKIKQVTLVEKTHLDKTLINKYLAGRSNAGQEKLTILADALNVNEIWLMGYDVPMQRHFKTTTTTTKDIKLDSNLEQILQNYNKLNDLGKKKAYENIKDLTEISKYTEKNIEFKEA